MKIRKGELDTTDSVDYAVKRKSIPVDIQSPKCELELSPAIPSSIICDWWRLIHSGWKHPLDYLHGAAICAPKECYIELCFLHKIGTAIHESTAKENNNA